MFRDITKLFIFLSTALLHAEEFEFWNKIDVPVYYAVGNRQNPPSNSSSLSLLPAFNKKKEKWSKSNTISVNNSDFPQLLIKQEVDGKPAPFGQLYEFNPKKGTKIFVRLIDVNGTPSLEPQTYVWGNLDRTSITNKGVVGEGIQSKKPAPIAATVKTPPPLPTTPPKTFVKRQPVPQAPPLEMKQPAPESSARPTLAMPKNLKAPAAHQYTSLASAMGKRRGVVEEEEMEEEGEEANKELEIEKMAERIKQAVPNDTRLTPELLRKLAADYLNYPSVDFKNPKVLQTLQQKIAAASTRTAAGPIQLPKITLPAGR